MIRTTTAVQPFDGRRTLTLKAQKQYASAGKALTKKNSHYIKASERHSRKGISTAYKHRKSGRERDCSQHASAIRNRREWSRRLQLSMTPRHPAKRVTWRWGQIRRRPTLEESPDTPPKVLTMINASASVGSRHETPCNKTGCGHSLVDGVVPHNIREDKLCRSLCRAGRNGWNKRNERQEKFCHTPYYIIGRADKIAKEGREQL